MPRKRKPQNQQLLNTGMVKSSIVEYLKKGLTINEILQKLLDIHLIIIEKVDLKLFISDNKLKSNGNE